MKKIFLITVLIFLLTGCQVDYNLTIDKNLEVLEEVNMTGTNEFFSTYSKTSKINVIKMLFDDYSKNLLVNNNYNYEFVEPQKKEENPYLLASKKYNNLKDYSDNTIFYQQFFEDIKYSENGNLIRIETVGFNPNDPENPDRYNIHKLTIKIKSNYIVTDHNASKVNEDTNTYYYEINEDTEDFSLKFEFDKTKEFNPYLKTYLRIGICVLIIILTWTIIYYYNKRTNKKKKNA